MMTRDAQTKVLEIATALRRMRGEIEQINATADDRLTAAAGQLGHSAALLAEVGSAAATTEKFRR